MRCDGGLNPFWLALAANMQTFTSVAANMLTLAAATSDIIALATVLTRSLLRVEVALLLT